MHKIILVVHCESILKKLVFTPIKGVKDCTGLQIPTLYGVRTHDPACSECSEVCCDRCSIVSVRERRRHTMTWLCVFIELARRLGEAWWYGTWKTFDAIWTGAPCNAVTKMHSSYRYEFVDWLIWLKPWSYQKCCQRFVFRRWARHAGSRACIPVGDRPGSGDLEVRICLSASLSHLKLELALAFCMLNFSQSVILETAISVPILTDSENVSVSVSAPTVNTTDAHQGSRLSHI